MKKKNIDRDRQDRNGKIEIVILTYESSIFNMEREKQRKTNSEKERQRKKQKRKRLIEIDKTEKERMKQLYQNIEAQCVIFMEREKEILYQHIKEIERDRQDRKRKIEIVIFTYKSWGKIAHFPLPARQKHLFAHH